MNNIPCDNFYPAHLPKFTQGQTQSLDKDCCAVWHGEAHFGHESPVESIYVMLSEKKTSARTITELNLRKERTNEENQDHEKNNESN